MSVPAMQIQSTPTLADLLRGYADAPEMAIRGLASDSRKVSEGSLFLACQGIDSHGLDYLPEAIAAGATAVAWEANTAATPGETGVPAIAVQNLGACLGEIANRYYGHPSSTLKTIGVTGTNGKTTVAWLLAQCLQQLDRRCGYIGTLGIGVDELHGGEGMTTPAAVELHGELAGFVEQGATHAALEVSSHALSQGRVDGVNFDAVLFTNLSRDHLDYHGDMTSYFEAKASLFADYPSSFKIVNVDSKFGNELAARCDKQVVRVSTDVDRIANDDLYVTVRSIDAIQQGSKISFESSWGNGNFTFPLPGDFNVANAALVLAYLLASKVELEQACDVLRLATAPAGRMQNVASCKAAIYIDYAHTPDAMAAALSALRPHCGGKLWCIFGCGGDRDVGKRPQMGRLAESLADNIVITTDNPRSESPNAIIDDILAGLDRPDAATVIEDRAAAIAWVVANAAPADMILIAGKGHENYQEIDGERLPFSDLAVATTAAAGAGT